jgi:hypothetical protein
MAWRPIITDTRRRACIIAAIADIAEATRRHAVGLADVDEPSDHALLRTYLASDDTLADDDGVARTALAAAIEYIKVTSRPGLFGGVSRIGWTIAHLADGDSAEPACAAVDQALARMLPEWDGIYDLIAGVVGFGVYALERGPSGTSLAEAVVGWLEQRARSHRDGIAWFTRPELLPEYQREMAPDGYWNLGLAHGNAGVIALLARFASAGVARERSLALLEPAVAYLLAAGESGDEGRYASWQPGRPSRRLAWCYGDLGVAAALISSGILLEQGAWRAAGLALATECAHRSQEDAAIRDAAICHGALGVAHVFNRMAQATGDSELLAAAERWVDIGLSMRNDQPLAGFPAYVLKEGVRTWYPNATLLTGAPGVALVLHAAISELEPSWDRLLLVDLPPQ